MTSELTDGHKVEDGGEGGSPSLHEMKRELAEEFNVQRAKMKELFLQKEEDLRKIVQEKEQLDSEVLGLRAELQQLQTLSQNQKFEIQSLQLLVNETVEASSSGSEEVRRLRARNIELEQQLMQLRQQQDVSIAPATFVRSLARKLGADTDLEQPNKKNADDNELLRSMIQPLEMEISALKDKLRLTDAQLQDALKVNASKSAPGANGESRTDTDVRACDMCRNYEKQLVSEQKLSEGARERSTVLDQALRLATEELEGVRSLHDETVRSWHSERAANTQQIEELRASVHTARESLDARAAAVEDATKRALDRVITLTVDREILQKKLDTLERDNAMLMGKYTKKAADIQNEIIDLPDNVEDLQVSILELRQQLIICEIGREEAIETEAELRRQLLEQAGELQKQEAALVATQHELQLAREEVDRLQTEREQMKELGDKLRHSSDMIETLLEDKKRLQADTFELRSRVSALQQELDNSEKVQQDFVRLSQSLQVQLQRIREANAEVRWQHDDDVDRCPTCSVPLPNNRKKVHCRHCGRIFCASCVSHSVPSGPRQTPARVCSVCRTLLQPHTAPYFSTDPPRDPH